METYSATTRTGALGKDYPIAKFFFENERLSSFKQTDRINNI